MSGTCLTNHESMEQIFIYLSSHIIQFKRHSKEGYNYLKYLSNIIFQKPKKLLNKIEEVKSKDKYLSRFYRII